MKILNTNQSGSLLLWRGFCYQGSRCLMQGIFADMSNLRVHLCQFPLGFLRFAEPFWVRECHRERRCSFLRRVRIALGLAISRPSETTASVFTWFPGKLFRALGHELIAQRSGIMVIDQQESFAGSQGIQARKNQRMSLTRRNSSYIQGWCGFGHENFNSFSLAYNLSGACFRSSIVFSAVDTHEA